MSAQANTDPETLKAELFRETARGYTKPHRIQPGERYGELTAVEEMKCDRNGILWKLRCDCGGFAYRYTRRLNLAVRNGQSPSCARCLRELRSGAREERIERQNDRIRDLWYERGTLWSDFETAKLQARIMEDLELELCPRRNEDTEEICDKYGNPLPISTAVGWPWEPGETTHAKRGWERYKRDYDDMREEEAEEEFEEYDRFQRAQEAAARAAERAIARAETEAKRKVEETRKRAEAEANDLRYKDETLALEALVLVMAAERGFSLADVGYTIRDAILKGVLPRENTWANRKVRAQALIDGLKTQPLVR
jgi:hypothetical protein